PSAGEGFGHQFLPRIGQEVLVTFLAGDIDRPVVTSVLYNGDHSPPRFSNTAGLPGNRTLSGIQTREHKGRGFNELLFDDTPGELRARMATTHHATELNLGKLAMPRTDGKALPRGNGAELRTDAAIALRAAQGMLLTTYARHGAQGSQLDREELLKLLEECGDLFQSLGQTAAARGGQQVDSQGIEALRQSLNQWPAADSNQAGAPIAALAAEAGIISATPRSQVHYAGENHDTTAQDHLQLTSDAVMHLRAGKGISAFAQDEGIKVIANRGKVLMQAQEDDIALNAQKNLQLSAAEGEVVISAPTIRLVADDGSYIKIGG
ncbi:type VI secretion system Vgr family protein, partial [Pseudomonas sp. EA_35y_Pfl1_P108]|uniref:type VI secretion system Vgr family protein n=1 Tax=Pseudomonas sp. EA_35y_Pfl1_P108 TaxID=3088688 RepID=UPI0030D78E80